MPSQRCVTRRSAKTALAAAVVGGLVVTMGPTVAAPDQAPAQATAPAAPDRAAAPDGPAAPDGSAPAKQPVAIGAGGAVSSVDADASRIGAQVLRDGGNAVDAAVATAAALGVTEPYSSGLGGGGFFVSYDASTGDVSTIDGRETAPGAMPHDAFIDPETGTPYPFFPDLVTSGVSVGVPGTPATWETALDRWGTRTLAESLMPASQLASQGFVVDPTFRQQTLENAERFSAIEPTADLFLPGGDAPEVGSVFRNPELAATYRLLGRQGMDAFYDGPIADQIVDVVQSPPKTDDTDLPVPPGYMAASDISGYDVVDRAPTHVGYRGLDVYGMGPPSSGGSTVGEALNILETVELGAMAPPDALHHYLEASALAFADRNKYVGDSDFVDVPLDELLSDDFAAERACQVDPYQAAAKPVPAGEPDGDYGDCTAGGSAETATDTEGLSTTHLSVMDKWSNVVAYTLTIEQTGGSAITVPGRGFLLNNELTDFSTVYNPADPNRIEGGKRPRSSMSPTIVLRDGEPWLAVGSPGGSTIITTVLQTLINRIDFGMTLPEAIAAPRGSQRNTASVTAEQEFIDAYQALLEPYGHTMTRAGAPGTSAAEIGAVAAIEALPGGQFLAAAEPRRRGGGSAMVVSPAG
jgi:gamma-glutamyltranspeptidase/glutathione hydrolase